MKRYVLKKGLLDYMYLVRYDRGNLVLTDFDLKILNILRPRVAGEEKFLVMGICQMIVK